MLKRFAILLALGAANLRAQVEQGLQDEFALHPGEAVISDRFALDAIFAIDMAYKQSTQANFSGAAAANTQRLQSLQAEVGTLGEWLVSLKTTSYVIAEEENALLAQRSGRSARLPDESACRDELIASLSRRRALPVYPACSQAGGSSQPSLARVQVLTHPPAAATPKQPQKRGRRAGAVPVKGKRRPERKEPPPRARRRPRR